MSERMLVTQALDERALLEKRIADAIQDGELLDIIKPNEETGANSRLTREEFTKRAESIYQRINDLIARYDKIDAAIMESNSKTKIKTEYGELTVASAISLKNRIKASEFFIRRNNSFEMMFLDRMKKLLDSCTTDMEKKNKELYQTAENMRLSILGKDTKVKADSPLDVVDTYVKENTTELLDPIDIKAKIKELSDKTSALVIELETRIKVSNATTFIEI